MVTCDLCSLLKALLLTALLKPYFWAAASSVELSHESIIDDKLQREHATPVPVIKQHSSVHHPPDVVGVFRGEGHKFG